VWLTPRERRALRAIEEALTAEDPALAERLREPPGRWRARQLRRVGKVATWIAVILLLAGLLLSDAGLFVLGLLMLIVFLGIWRWAAAAAMGDT
jgi:uncharacterized RDD family membrane protein YckC